jgi:hypothetical protein
MAIACRVVWPNPHAVLTRSYRAVGSSVDRQKVEHRSLAPSPPWAAREAKEDRQPRLAKGVMGRRWLTLTLPSELGSDRL